MMKIILVILVVLVSGLLVLLLIEARRIKISTKLADESLKTLDSKTEKQESPSKCGCVSEILISVLDQMGCQYRRDEEGRFIIKYQGEYFKVCTENKCLFLDIWQASCYTGSLDESDMLADVINTVNVNVYPKVLSVITNENVQLYIKTNVLLSAEVPNKELFLSGVFKSFITTTRYLLNTIEEKRLSLELNKVGNTSNYHLN